MRAPRWGPHGRLALQHLTQKSEEITDPVRKDRAVKRRETWDSGNDY